MKRSLQHVHQLPLLQVLIVQLSVESSKKAVQWTTELIEKQNAVFKYINLLSVAFGLSISLASEIEVVTTSRAK